MACRAGGVSDKIERFGEFFAGLLVAGASGAALFWGTVSANRADIDVLRTDMTAVKDDVAEVSDDTAYMRGQLDVITTHILTGDDPDE